MMMMMMIDEEQTYYFNYINKYTINKGLIDLIHNETNQIKFYLFNQ